MSRRILTVASLALAVALPVGAQTTTSQDSVFNWSGKISSGAWLRIRDVKGAVKVTEGSGDQVKVRGERRMRRNGEGDLVFHVKMQADGDVVICAYWPDESQCTAGGIEAEDHHDDSAWPSADFTVQLPKGVKLDVRTGNGRVDVERAGADLIAESGNGEINISTVAGSVRAETGNGALTVDGAQGPVRANSGNGRVRVTTATGPVNASTGNGDIDVSMRSLKQPDNMSFDTGNGHITVLLPAAFEGEVDSHTGNGKVMTDFPISVDGRLDSQHLRGTIGKGGPRIRLSTGNGDLELRKVSGD